MTKTVQTIIVVALLGLFGVFLIRHGAFREKRPPIQSPMTTCTWVHEPKVSCTSDICVACHLKAGGSEYVCRKFNPRDCN